MPEAFLPIEPGSLEDLFWEDELDSDAKAEDSGSELDLEIEDPEDIGAEFEIEDTGSSDMSIPVWTLKCKQCYSIVNTEAMRVHLVADESVQLYSASNSGEVEEKGDEVKFSTCDCKIRKTCCGSCSQEVGYRVTSPCALCMSAQNNGHYWMFTEVVASVQYYGDRLVVW
eukprot:CAMPEP_0167828164 /NCGR_PEP_ID=MMETSP0112_2-20121227/11215_1 /TAXON_ID=91324 /ORGANISM="Lotharella globosa, Strain CCCM811" /LENGTH=169 /DNA_ID=CAMNT_0007731243 /DNA_START=21 /DNA_END=527 /DNA_ORIENTATION=+